MWKDLKGYEGLYKANEDGDIYSVRSKKLLKASRGAKGYYSVSLHKDDEQVSRYVHRLIADTFIPNPNDYVYVYHLNKDKSDNRVSNLEWRYNNVKSRN